MKYKKIAEPPVYQNGSNEYTLDPPPKWSVNAFKFRLNTTLHAQARLGPVAYGKKTPPPPHTTISALGGCSHTHHGECAPLLELEINANVCRQRSYPKISIWLCVCQLMKLEDMGEGWGVLEWKCYCV
jgi:hypothetical protein